MQRLLVLACVIAATLGVRSAVCQEIHAVTDDGKHVVLASDGTWKYSSAGAASAAKYFRDLGSHFSLVIPASSQWRAADENLMKDAEFSFSTADEKGYGVVITEQLPLKEDELVNYLKSHLDSTGSILSDRHVEVNGIPLRRVQFDASGEGLNFRYNFDLYVADDWYVKVLTWSFRSVAEKTPELLTSLTPFLKVNK